MTTPPVLQHEFWPGPLRPTSPRKAIDSTRCVGMVRHQTGDVRRCVNGTINGDFLCYACKDPGGYAARLRQAHHEARRRCLEAYPVCRHCGRPLSQAQVHAGQTTHPPEGEEGCRLPDDDEPSARRIP